MNTPRFSSLLRNPVQLLAFGFGSGLAPRAPGTFGTLAALPLYWLLVQGPWLFFAAFVLVALLAGIYWCDRAARELGVHDHPGIVWDEIVGYLITLLMIPQGWTWVLAGFLLFRLLDIWKPWPIRWVDRRVGGGLGIMLDDVLAGLGAGVLLQGLAWAIA
jgi:phosphatidylglycerophosphatase A